MPNSTDSAVCSRYEAIRVARTFDWMILFTLFFVILGGYHIHYMLTGGDWDFWTDWKDRRLWVTVAPIVSITFPAAVQSILWFRYRLPFGAVVCITGLLLGEWVNRYLNFWGWTYFPVNFCFPSNLMPGAIVLDVILMLSNSMVLTAVVGGLAWGLLFYPGNWPIIAPLHVPVEYNGMMMTLADLQGYHYVRTGTPEYIRMVEKGTLRTFGKDVAPVSAFFSGFVCIIIYFLWHFFGKWFGSTAFVKTSPDGVVVFTSGGFPSSTPPAQESPDSQHYLTKKDFSITGVSKYPSLKIKNEPSLWQEPVRSTEEYEESSTPDTDIFLSEAPDIIKPPHAERFLNAQTNDRVNLGDDFGLTVQVCTKTISPGAGFGSITLDGGSSGRQIAGTVRIDVYAPGFKLTDGTSKPLEVPETSDSAPVRFGLKAINTGVHRIQINAWFGASYIGAVEVMVSVDTLPVGNGIAGSGLSSFESGDGEYSLEITYHKQEKCYEFHMFGTEVNFEHIRGEPLSGQSLDIYDSIIRDMNAEARNLYYKGGHSLLAWLEGTGGDMFRKLVPQTVQEQLLDNADKIKSIKIFSRNDNLPWELLFVVPKDGSNGRFLMDSAIISRHVYGRALSKKLNKNPLYYVLPQGALTSAQSEYQLLQGKLGQGKTISDIDALIDLFRTGGFGLVHFMAHNIDAKSPHANPYIPFSQDQFSLNYMGTISDKKYLKDAPFVFINACTSAGSKPLYVDMSGWATRFLECGVAAYLGTLWEIRDASAAKFAEAFYEELTSGKNLGESMAAGRNALLRSDPTYYAYSLYGNPLAKLV